VEVALSADDSGDNDWVINFSCPACESAERPHLLAAAGAASDGEPRRAPPSGEARVGGSSANPMYDPAAP
jgi:hypothetical protein